MLLQRHRDLKDIYIYRYDGSIAFIFQLFWDEMTLLHEDNAINKIRDKEFTGLYKYIIKSRLLISFSFLNIKSN